MQGPAPGRRCSAAGAQTRAATRRAPSCSGQGAGEVAATPFRLPTSFRPLPPTDDRTWGTEGAAASRVVRWLLARPVGGQGQPPSFGCPTSFRVRPPVGPAVRVKSLLSVSSKAPTWADRCRRRATTTDSDALPASGHRCLSRWVTRFGHGVSRRSGSRGCRVRWRREAIGSYADRGRASHRLPNTPAMSSRPLPPLRVGGAGRSGAPEGRRRWLAPPQCAPL